jgi:hypothetical protein
MSRPKRFQHPSHATVVAYLALFVALGGSSYAALRVGTAAVLDNSLRSRDIKNDDVRGKDIRNRTITAKDIALRKLGREHFRAGQLSSGKPGAMGPQGPQGARGPQGLTGAPGTPATTLWATVNSSGILRAASGVLLPAGSDVNALGGDIRIPFTRDVSGCARIATIGGTEISGGIASSQRGFIQTTLASATQVDVGTTETDGSGNVDTYVHLVVIC